MTDTRKEGSQSSNFYQFKQKVQQQIPVKLKTNHKYPVITCINKCKIQSRINLRDRLRRVDKREHKKNFRKEVNMRGDLTLANSQMPIQPLTWSFPVAEGDKMPWESWWVQIKTGRQLIKYLHDNRLNLGKINFI